MATGAEQQGGLCSGPAVASGAPSSARSPSVADRSAKDKAKKELQGRYEIVEAQVRKDVAESMEHGRVCLVGFALLEAVRLIAWLQDMRPIPATWGIHFILLLVDVSSGSCGGTFLFHGVRDRVTKKHLLSTMMSIVSLGAFMSIFGLVALLVATPPRPLAPDWVPLLERMQFAANVWEAACLASTALNLALLVTTFRIFRELRIAGLHPPGSKLIAEGKRLTGVSPLEMALEPEDMALLGSTCGCAGLGKDELTQQELLVPRGGDARGVGAA